MMMAFFGIFALMFFFFAIVLLEEGETTGAILSFLTAVALAGNYLSNIQS